MTKAFILLLLPLTLLFVGCESDDDCIEGSEDSIDHPCEEKPVLNTPHG